jgi:cell division protein ZapE
LLRSTIDQFHLRLFDVTKALFPLTPVERYQQDLLRSDFIQDACQKMVIAKLQDLYLRTLHPSKTSIIDRLFNRNPVLIKGLYLWGGVGRGKTYLMDVFYDALPFQQKMRTHFHRFMREVHEELAKLKNQKNPLLIVADLLAKKARVLCFDEFFVTDITDAMILAGLLEALFDRGVILVATSNIEPQDLYKGGLQRERFLPAIDLLLTRTEIVNVDGDIDYRLRALQQAALFYSPLGPSTELAMQACFSRLAPDSRNIKQNIALTIEGRRIFARQQADDTVWFDFASLCDGPRSQRDYIELASEYHAVLISNVPKMAVGADDQARRFIYLVDEFYDRNVKVVISAEVSIMDLYPESGRLRFEFQRTQSRLLEMQSEAYLARAHKG